MKSVRNNDQAIQEMKEEKLQFMKIGKDQRQEHNRQYTYELWKKTAQQENIQINFIEDNERDKKNQVNIGALNG